MHRARLIVSAVAAVLPLAAVAWGAEKSAVVPEETVSVRVPATEADLELVDEYTIEVERGGVSQSYNGRLIQATDKWVVLRTVTVEAERQGLPVLMDIPKVGRVFYRNLSIAQENDVWIPREAATVTSHVSVEKPAKVRSGRGDQPPPWADCVVELVTAGKLDRRQGDLTAVGADKVTLSHDDGKQRQQIARADILCITLPQARSEVTAERASTLKRR